MLSEKCQHPAYFVMSIGDEESVLLRCLLPVGHAGLHSFHAWRH